MTLRVDAFLQLSESSASVEVVSGYPRLEEAAASADTCTIRADAFVTGTDTGMSADFIGGIAITGSDVSASTETAMLQVDDFLTGSESATSVDSIQFGLTASESATSSETIAAGFYGTDSGASIDFIGTASVVLTDDGTSSDQMTPGAYGYDSDSSTDILSLDAVASLLLFDNTTSGDSCHLQGDDIPGEEVTHGEHTTKPIRRSATIKTLKRSDTFD